MNQLHSYLVTHQTNRASIICAMTLLLMAIGLIQLNWIDLRIVVTMGFFPALIWLAAALDTKGISSGAIGVKLGSITYSSYLLHVPIQIFAIMILDSFGYRNAVASPLFLGAYILCVITAAFLAYKLVELPLKSRSRKFLLKMAK